MRGQVEEAIMIVIEGPDGVGKTTAARELCRMNGLAYHHLGPPGRDFDHVGFYLAAIDPAALWDRFHLGEEAYGHLGISKRGTWLQRLTVRDALEQARACVIVMYASDPASLRPKAPSVELYPEILIRAVNARYQEIAETTTWATITHDVTARGWPDSSVLESWSNTWRAMRS